MHTYYIFNSEGLRETVQCLPLSLNQAEGFSSYSHFFLAISYFTCSLSFCSSFLSLFWNCHYILWYRWFSTHFERKVVGDINHCTLARPSWGILFYCYFLCIHTCVLSRSLARIFSVTLSVCVCLLVIKHLPLFCYPIKFHPAAAGPDWWSEVMWWR